MPTLQDNAEWVINLVGQGNPICRVDKSIQAKEVDGIRTIYVFPKVIAKTKEGILSTDDRYSKRTKSSQPISAPIDCFNMAFISPDQELPIIIVSNPNFSTNPKDISKLKEFKYIQQIVQEKEDLRFQYDYLKMQLNNLRQLIQTEGTSADILDILKTRFEIIETSIVQSRNPLQPSLPKPEQEEQK